MFAIDKPLPQKPTGCCRLEHAILLLFAPSLASGSNNNNDKNIQSCHVVLFGSVTKQRWSLRTLCVFRLTRTVHSKLTGRLAFAPPSFSAIKAITSYWIKQPVTHAQQISPERKAFFSHCCLRSFLT